MFDFKILFSYIFFTVGKIECFFMNILKIQNKSVLFVLALKS
ncbi:hypothetical protein CCO1342 [Campylobacter coli RM2228]|nr:hypothetical protein CCO1342 [Campylobacter coli RM2228]